MTATTPTKRATTEDDITAEVLRRYEGTPDPRLKQIMQSLTKHVHAFIKEVGLTEKEWFHAIDFLTRTGQMCDERRQEFILLSDTTGVSMLVDLISNRKPLGATESTVFGPFHRDGAPERELGTNMAEGEERGEPCIITGRVTGLDGKPIAGAKLDTWQADPGGFYDSQRPELDHMHMRGIYTTGADGRYTIVTTRPVHYQIPSDGPVGEMLRATKRHSWRPAHVHFVVSADGYEPVTTHIFDSIDPDLNGDAVFGVKDSLICEFKTHTAPTPESQKLGVKVPFCTTNFDFVLAPAKKA
jgi:protocatechuate 3,4-dioxygenase beta subunit